MAAEHHPNLYPIVKLLKNYEGMPALDTVNRNAQFLIGIEEAIRTTGIFKRTPCSVIDMYAANSFALAYKFSQTYMGTKNKKKGGMSGFVRDICIGQD
eukprot:8323386-Ditylum_brightwellii.AAC.1